MFLFDNRIPIVRPYLLLGAAQHERDYALLEGSGITHILQVGSELRPSYPDRFKYLRISIDDAEQEDLIKQLPRCFKFINDARRRGNDGDGVYDGSYGGEHSEEPATDENGNGTSNSAGVVLVHCLAGMSRSATVVLTYLMWDEKMPYTEALTQVKAARPCMYPNLGFLLQVWEWEASGCDLEAWDGWSKVRFAERLAEYRRAQLAAGLHRSVRVRLPMSPARAGPAAPVTDIEGYDRQVAAAPSGGGVASISGSDGDSGAPGEVVGAAPALTLPFTPRSVSSPPLADSTIAMTSPAVSAVDIGDVSRMS